MYRPGQRKPTRAIPIIQYVTCPSCKKDRLPKPLDENGKVVSASKQTVDVRGETRYLDVCSFCVVRYRQLDERFVEKNMRKLSQAMKERDVSDKDSDHTDFSLDI